MKLLLEICANSIHSALAAEAGGAQRIELCQHLEQGGTTPSAGLLRQVRARVAVPVFALIRPRPGHFVYDADELEIMRADIEISKALGADGIVSGILTPAARVDVPAIAALVAAAHPLPFTFHRAFDDCPDAAQALEDIIAAGCRRILTAGGAASARAGQARLTALVRQAAGRLIIMPGAGITAANVAALAAATGATEFHASAKRLLAPAAEAASPTFAAPEWRTDAAEVAALRRALGGA